MPIKIRHCIIFLCILGFSEYGYGQQVPDTSYNKPGWKPKYNAATGSTVMIDEAHNNFHRADYLYAPFAKILRQDGYYVVKGEHPITLKNLNGVKILVIANAINIVNIRNPKLPIRSAFTAIEIETIKEWVNNGGSIFLIADHMPFAGAAADLASPFGYHFYNGFAINKATYRKAQPDIFMRSDGSLQTTGLSGLENVDSIATFVGQGFSIPKDAVSIINLDKRFNILMPEVAWKFDKNTERLSGTGLSQGAYSKLGHGRIVVFGEAAMFSAQKVKNKKAGMNTPEGAQNYLLLLSLIHWLDEGK